jgi:hypothetical protein
MDILPAPMALARSGRRRRGTASGCYHDTGDLFVEFGDHGSRIFGSVVSDDVLVNRLGVALVQWLVRRTSLQEVAS